MINQKLNYKLLLLLIGSLLLLIPYGKVSATLPNTGCEGQISGSHYKRCRVDSGNSKKIYCKGTDCNYTCREVKNNCGEHVFIPTKTCNEWNKFVAFHPGCINTSGCAKPDLTITEVQLNPGYNDISYWIKNIGEAKSDFSKQGLYVDGNLKDTSWASDLDPGQEAGPYTFTDWKCSSGQHNIEVRADYRNDIAEEKENNNRYTKNIDCGAGCTCTSWSAGSCGGGSCSSNYREYTRNCNPSGCNNESKCNYDSSCSFTINLPDCPSFGGSDGIWAIPHDKDWDEHERCCGVSCDPDKPIDCCLNPFHSCCETESTYLRARVGNRAYNSYEWVACFFAAEKHRAHDVNVKTDYRILGNQDIIPQIINGNYPVKLCKKGRDSGIPECPFGGNKGNIYAVPEDKYSGDKGNWCRIDSDGGCRKEWGKNYMVKTKDNYAVSCGKDKSSGYYKHDYCKLCIVK